MNLDDRKDFTTCAIRLPDKAVLKLQILSEELGMDLEQLLATMILNNSMYGELNKWRV